MPVQPSYPGVYIEEVPSGQRTITAVSTSVAAFVGRTARGDINAPIRCFSFADFERKCGGLWSESELGYAVYHFYLNGGSEAIVSRVATGAQAATVELPETDSAIPLSLEAASPGSWGNRLQATVSYGTAGEIGELTDPDLFHLTIEEIDPLTAQAVTTETFSAVSVSEGSPRYVATVLAQQSRLARVDTTAVPPDRPDEGTLSFVPGSGTDGGDGSIGDYEDAIDRLLLADIVNLLVLPPPDRVTSIATAVLDKALSFCTEQRAMLLVDPPARWADYEAAARLDGGYSTYRSANSAFFYPQMLAPDPLQEGRARAFAPSGAIAGVIARTDTERGVWKAPAGITARLQGATGLTIPLTDDENGVLNPKGINALRQLPIHGPVIWGSRTGVGADVLASEWKYFPVRRTALFIEQTLHRNLRWAVFEPNDEPLWAQLRQSVGDFMRTLFRQGAFAGETAREAYSVQCGPTTTTPDDVARGVVNILVGFAPLRPAEFIVLQFQQLAGQ
ncbi:MAG: phage tail sheath subtilisin-like domain-containing protein [Nannocystaceae bacterium]